MTTSWSQRSIVDSWSACPVSTWLGWPTPAPRRSPPPLGFGPDLVPLDIYLPDITGLDVLRQLREGEQPVNVVAITAARDVGTIRSALRGGVVHYLIKPFTFDVLRDRLERFAAAHRRLGGVGTVDPDDVDRLFGALRPTRVTLPKGLTQVASRTTPDWGRFGGDGHSVGGLDAVNRRRIMENGDQPGGEYPPWRRRQHGRQPV